MSDMRFEAVRLDEWRMLRLGPLYAAVSPDHVWFRLWGRGLAARKVGSWMSLSERYAGQHGFPVVRWVRVAGWQVRWLGVSQ